MQRCLDDGVGAQVTIACGGRTDRDRLIRPPHVQREGVGLGEYRDACDAEPPRGALDPAGDLAAIGNQDFAEHALWPHMRNTPKCVSGMGAVRLAAKPKPRHMRVSIGSMMPSSQSRA